MKKLTLVAGAVALVLSPVLALPALADAAQEVSTAATHAGLAAKQGAIDGVHMHLHHALNCLVGPGGEGFDAGQANPCAKQGNGAIPDTTDAAMKAKLEGAVASAKSGIAATDLAMAKADAEKTAAALK
ncbi:MAG: hypothetical protein BGN85_14145 [Alphaproteobacteria bacterium 64-11]|nr:hypothetical protein [Alphaproteobacteria bacterium]OJU13789.1 MAG: hypothetical protein BGN85_14145 [Alphaproteobacteria bacterium 64-11]